MNKILNEVLEQLDLKRDENTRSDTVWTLDIARAIAGKISCVLFVPQIISPLTMKYSLIFLSVTVNPLINLIITDGHPEEYM